MYVDYISPPFFLWLSFGSEKQTERKKRWVEKEKERKGRKSKDNPIWHELLDVSVDFFFFFFLVAGRDAPVTVGGGRREMRVEEEERASDVPLPGLSSLDRQAREAQDVRSSPGTPGGGGDGGSRGIAASAVTRASICAYLHLVLRLLPQSPSHNK